jgi:hypothetical protein
MEALYLRKGYKRCMHVHWHSPDKVILEKINQTGNNHTEENQTGKNQIGKNQIGKKSDWMNKTHRENSYNN